MVAVLDVSNWDVLPVPKVRRTDVNDTAVANDVLNPGVRLVQ